MELLVDDRLRERDEEARGPPERHPKRANGVDDARQRRVGRAHVRDRDARIEAEPAADREAVHLRALDREHAELRAGAAVGGEAAHLAAGGEHAMAGHDDRERVAAEGLADGACGARRAGACRDVAVGERGAGRDGPRYLVHAAVKRRHALHVERDPGEVAGSTAEERGDGVEGALHAGRGIALAGGGKPLQHARPRGRLRLFRQLHAGDAARPPGDPAAADRRVEERELPGRHPGAAHTITRTELSASHRARACVARIPCMAACKLSLADCQARLAPIRAACWSFVPAAAALRLLFPTVGRAQR